MRKSVMRKYVIPAAIVAFAFASNAARADWKAVEDKGLKTITEVDFDDGVWKIEAHQTDGKEITLKVDPVTGEIRQ